MKIRVSKQIIESILINMQPFLEKKDASQITSHIFFEVVHNQCIVKSTDLEIGLQIITEQIAIEEGGSFTANGKKLLDIVRILKDEEIVLEAQDGILLIKQKHSNFKLPTFDANAFPSFPTIDQKPEIALNAHDFVHSLKQVSPSIDTNNPKVELNGAHISIKTNKTDIVGTNTKRLAIATIPGQSAKGISIIIPKKAILEIQKLFIDEITIYYDTTYLIITNKSYFFYTRLINGKYPDYERIIPKNIKHTLTLPKREIMEAIKMITTISQEIKMTIQPEIILFQSLSTDNIEAKTEIEISTGLNEKFEFSYNSKNLLDFLSQIDGEKFELGINEPTLPFVVKENNFMTIIMSIVL